VGIDVGNNASCCALARKRGVDVILNKESSRETPSVVNFSERMRLTGTDGAAKMGMAPANTVHSLKRLLGRKFKDPMVQTELPRLPFSVTEAPDGRCQVNVQYMNEPHSFSIEQCMAMVLVDQKRLAEVESGVSAVDCVLSVPASYTESQRMAMLNASTIAGLNCLRLINENTATALAYGIYKATELPEHEPVYVAFVDVGHSMSQVSIVGFKRSGMEVKLHAFDEYLGGRDFDELVFTHFCEEIKAQHKLDIRSNKKASFKLRTACEKMKKMLSANAEAPYNIECIMEDIDVKGMIKREQLEELSKPIIEKFKALLQQAVAKCGIDLAKIASVEIVGSATRTPALVRTVEEVFQKGASRTLNAKEVVCRGAALQCAMLSPVFKVREFDIVDACPYTLELEWDKEGVMTKQSIFEANSPFPNSKMLTLLRSKPFTVNAYTAENGEKLAEYQVGPFEVPAGKEKATLKAKVRMNLHGISAVESIQSIEEEAPAPSEEVKDVKMEEADAAAAANADASAPGPAPEGDANAAPQTGASPMDTESTGGPEAGAAPQQPPPSAAATDAAKKTDKKRRVKKHDVPFTVKLLNALDAKQVEAFFEQECQMQAQDKLQEETSERKNALEGYILSLRNKIYEKFAPFVKESEKEAIIGKLQVAEDWLYDEGEDVNKSVYAAKLDEMKLLGGPIEERYMENENRPAAIQALRSSAESYATFAQNTSPQYAHITPEERETIAKEATSALIWLEEKMALQTAQCKTEMPVLRTEDCYKKRDTLERVCKPIATKPAPKPAAPPPQPQAQQQPAQGPTAEEVPAQQQEGASPMEEEQPAPQDQPAANAAPEAPK